MVGRHPGDAAHLTIVPIGGILALVRSVLTFVLGALVVACRSGHGPHLTVPSPQGPSPTFGDAPSHFDAEPGRSGGAVGGNVGAAGDAPASSRSAPSAANVAATAAGVAVGGAALVVTATSGAVTCKPGDDSATSDAGAINVCSGEHKQAAPDLSNAFTPR